MKIFYLLLLFVLISSCTWFGRNKNKLVIIDDIDEVWIGDTLLLPMGNAIIPRPSNWTILDEEDVFYKVCSDSCNDMLTIDVYNLSEYELNYEELINSYKEILRNTYQVDTIFPFRFEGEDFNALGIKYNLRLDDDISLRESIFLNYGEYVLSFSFGVSQESKKDRENRFSFLHGTIFLSSVFPDTVINVGDISD